MGPDAFNMKYLTPDEEGYMRVELPVRLYEPIDDYDDEEFEIWCQLQVEYLSIIDAAKKVRTGKYVWKKLDQK